jgi:hypothetical protein
VLGFVWWGTNFSAAAERRRLTTPSGRVDVDTIGRSAGRLFAKANEAIRKKE